MSHGQRRPFAGFLDACGNVLDQMGLVAMNDQKRIGLGDDNDVVEACYSEEPVFGPQVAVADVNRQHIAKARVTGFIKR